MLRLIKIVRAFRGAFSQTAYVQPLLMTRPFSAENLKSKAVALGFDRVGIVRAEPSPLLTAYERWIAAGMHADMGYMARPDRVARRRDLNVILPGVQSMIVVVVDYGSTMPADVLQDPRRGRIAAYAWGVDYHAVITPRLEQLAAWMRAEHGDGLHRVYVDTGAILERSHAYAAGLGFTGKNTLLIHPRQGSLFFIAEILTDLAFDTYDVPSTAPTMCGRCTRCLTACPTDAFPAPHVLDARRCISYLTIEHKTEIDPALRPRMGNWIYGCDVCQDVCPFQRFAPQSREPLFCAADVERAAPLLRDVLALDDAGFGARYGGSAIMRIKRERLVRNACVAAGNSGDSSLIPALVALMAGESDLIAHHAAWAVEHLEKHAI
ncbi:MAG: tRNA epoxyqueuosine(34) reductase QueG [bacterium]|nr:tRNA epoxyqueuosine(34) reductase QueG [bacterium]